MQKNLDKLDISRRVIVSARARRQSDTIEHRRQKLTAHLEEQIELAQLTLSGETPELLRKRGHSVVNVRPRIWWTTDEDGHTATVIRYNGTNLNLAGRGSTIEVGPLRKLPTVYRTVIRAVKAGELDQDD